VTVTRRVVALYDPDTPHQRIDQVEQLDEQSITII